MFGWPGESERVKTRDEEKGGAPILHRFMQEVYQIPEKLIHVMEEADAALQEAYGQIEQRAALNQLRLLHIFQRQGVTDFHLHGSTGYGYGDVGREVLEAVFAAYFGGEAALVRSQIMSGTHALALGFFGVLRPGDELISAAGPPYDTLQKVIGLHGEADALVDMGVSYREIALAESRGDGDEAGVVDLPRLLGAIGDKTKMVFLQRSKGYHWRPSLGIDELAKVIAGVKKRKSDVVCLVDNCYCEMVETQEPGEVGADLTIGSLIKNPGGTLSPCGGYVVGKKHLVEACGRRLSAPGLSADMGASLGFNRLAFQGLFQAPQTVGQSLKGAVLAAEFFSRLGYAVLPPARGKASGAAPEAGGFAPEAGEAVPGTSGAAPAPEAGGFAPEAGETVPGTGGAASEGSGPTPEAAKPTTEAGEAVPGTSGSVSGGGGPAPEAGGPTSEAGGPTAAHTWAFPGRADIVQAIKLGDVGKLIRFCQAIQRACPLDSAFVPEPAMLPGYSHPVIMAGGSFIQGASSELSADGPMRPPYIAYLQGGFSLAQIKLGLLLAAKAICAER